jgi:hypothetical protein
VPKTTLVSQFLENPKAPMTAQIGRRLCRFVHNTGFKSTDDQIAVVIEAVRKHTPPVDAGYFSATRQSISDMLYRKDYARRATAVSRRFSDDAAWLLMAAPRATIVDIETPESPYRGRSGNYNNGPAYLVWRFEFEAESLDVFHVPWQNSVNPEKTGLFIHT